MHGGAGEAPLPGDRHLEQQGLGVDVDAVGPRLEVLIAQRLEAEGSLLGGGFGQCLLGAQCGGCGGQCHQSAAAQSLQKEPAVGSAVFSAVVSHVCSGLLQLQPQPPPPTPAPPKAASLLL